jgi:modified peptide precursor CbpA
MKKRDEEKATKKVIGYRKSCKAEGVGLSHYILIGKDLKNEE